MTAISGKKLCRVLEDKDWYCSRIRGSHHVYVKNSITFVITIPVHKNQDLKIGLLRAIMKMANLTEKDIC